MLIAPVGAIGGEIFGVHEDTLMVILDVSDSVYLQVLFRDSGIRQNNIAKEISSVNGLVDPLISPGLVVPSYQKLSTIEYLIPATGYSGPRSVQDVL